jgi:hypothetical protein
VSEITLSPEAMARIRAEARAEIDKEIKARSEIDRRELAKKAKEEEMQRLRREAGLTSHLDDLVEYTLNLPPFAPLEGLMIDGESFAHGRTYTVRRAKFDVLREQVARGWDAEERAGNPNLRKYDRRYTSTMNPYMQERLVNGHLAARESTINAATGAVENAPINPGSSGPLPAHGRAA